MDKTKTHIIITADDYGFCDEVDKGIIAAAKTGLISSVAALPNGHYSAERLGFLKQIQEDYKAKRIVHSDSKVDHLSVGCHFTITSGKPFTEAASNNRFLTKNNGYFRGYTKMRFPRKRKKQEELEEIVYKELIEQLCHMRRYVDIDHLSSHHDSLIFFDEYYSAFLRVSKETGIPVRSPIMRPRSREKLYYGQVGFRSFGNLFFGSWLEYRKFRKKRLHGLMDLSSEISCPDYLFGGNYMSGTLAGGVYEPGTQNSMVRSKYFKHYDDREDKSSGTSLYNSVECKNPLDMDGSIVEICAHLIDPENNIDYNEGGPRFARKTEKGKPNPHYYPGVTTSYFDGREIEYKLLEMMKPRIYNDKQVNILNWKSLATPKPWPYE